MVEHLKKIEGQYAPRIKMLDEKIRETEMLLAQLKTEYRSLVVEIVNASQRVSANATKC